MKLSNYRITSRIYGGFGALVLLGTLMAAFGVWQLGSIDNQIGRLFRVANNEGRTVEVVGLVQSLRHLGLKYKTGTDDATAKQFIDDQARAVGLVTKLAEGADSPERAGLYKDAATALGATRQGMDKLAQLATKAKADRAKLFTGGDDLTAATEHLLATARATKDTDLDLKSGDLESAILMVQVATWRFLSTNDPKGPATFKTALDKAGVVLDNFASATQDEQVRKEIATVKTALGAYAGSFQSLSAATLQADEIFAKEMQDQLVKTGEITEKAQKSVSDLLLRTKTATDDTVSMTMVSQEALGVLAVLIGLAFAFLIGRSIALPVTAMTAAMKKLAGGDKSAHIPARDHHDEIGEMAKAVEIFKESMIEADRLAAEQREEHAKKELRQKAVDDYVVGFDRSVQASLKTLTAASTEMRATAQSMSATAEETSRQATGVAGASEQTSANVQTVASSAEEMGSSIDEISRQVTESSRIATKAVEEAARTNATVQGLADAAQKIGDVVNLIQDIASQTNLLALNATIEAARAGEAGKGFAVVASEVKSLATQTAKATEEIGAQITAIQVATKDAVDAIQTIDGTITRINEISTTIASAMEEQGAATREIARNTQEAARGTQEVSQGIAGVNQAAGETGSAAAQVLASAEELGRQALTLRTDVDQFLAKIRAA